MFGCTPSSTGIGALVARSVFQSIGTVHSEPPRPYSSSPVGNRSGFVPSTIAAP
jgi:hypothetical protein